MGKDASRDCFPPLEAEATPSMDCRPDLHEIGIGDDQFNAIKELHARAAMGLVACGLVHDFKNALAVMMGQTELARQAMPECPKADEALDKVLQSGRKAADLSKRLLELTFSLKEKPTLQHMGTLLRDAAKLLGPALGRDLFLRILHVDESLYVRIHPSEFYQLLSNLCINAAEASQRDSFIELRLLGRLASEADTHPSSCAELTVRDYGSGMSPDIAENVFLPFYTTKPSGTGLGLAVVKQVVESRGGSISVKSTPGQGSEFHVCFPAATVPQSSV